MRNPVHLSRLRMPALALALAVALPAAAQDATAPIEQQMNGEEFRDAGLHKLDPDELAALNRWLGNTVREESRRVSQRTEERVVQERRGFLSAGSNEKVEARIRGPFEGFGEGRLYRLDNGQVWRQTDAATLVGASGNDLEVTIAPGMFGVWYMQVKGYNTRAKVERVE